MSETSNSLPNITGDTKEIIPNIPVKKRLPILEITDIASINYAIKTAKKKTKDSTIKDYTKKINKIKDRVFNLNQPLEAVGGYVETGNLYQHQVKGEQKPNFLIQSIQQVINEIHPDVKRFFNERNVLSYKSTADGLILKTDTGLTILAAHHKDRKKRYIIKQGKKEILNLVG